MDMHTDPIRSAPIDLQPSGVPHTALSRQRRWGFRIVAMSGSLTATLVGLELVLRLVTPPPAPIPRDSGDNAGAVDTTRNSLGLREPWERVPGGADAIRIAFLGDSFTFAACVEQRDGFVDKVERLLNAQAPPNGAGYVTINLGQPGTDPLVQSETYVTLKDQLKPYVLVHVAYCNDLGHDLYDELKLIHALENRRSVAAQLSYIWRFVEGRVRYARVKTRTLDYFRGGDSPFKRRRAWDRFRGGIERAGDAASLDGTRYVLVMFPWLYSLDDYPLADVHDGVRRLAQELNVPFLDLLDTFAGLDASELRVSVIDEHPNPRAHTLAAQAIARFLVTNNLLVSPKRDDGTRS